MKKLLTIIILLFAVKSYSQSYYKNLFDSQYKTHLGYSTSSDQLDFSWAASAHMEALALMYEKTKDTAYAETLIKCMGNVIDRRDDLREQKPSLGLSNISDYRDSTGPVWSTNHYNDSMNVGKPYAHMVHSANITYPMAKFAAIIKGDSTLHHLVSKAVLPARYANQNYITIANDLIQRIKETLTYHEDQWYTELYPNSNPSDNIRIGYYKERDSANGFTPPIKHPGIISPFNMQSSMGRVFVQMYRATKDSVYLTKVRQLSNFLKLNTSLDTNLGANTWKYWKKDNTLPDDVSHAGLTIAFPYECWKYKVSQNGNLIYTDSDIQAYSNTFTTDISTSPLFMHVGVGEHSEFWNLKTDVKSGQTPHDSYICYTWLCLSEYEKKMYQQIADIHAAKNYYDKIKIDNLSFYSSLTLALLVNYENLIVPTNTNHEWGESSDWRGVAGGNFYDDKEEFVVIRNYDGMIRVMEPDGRGFKSVINNKVYGSSYNWKGIAAGDFFGDRKSEIVALSNHSDPDNNGFYVLKVENNDIIEQSKLTGFGGSSDWAGIAAGNFISGGKDDFVAVRNYNKEVLVYQFNGTFPQVVRANVLNLPANSTIKAVASGNLRGDTKDEIVLLVDSGNDTKNGIHVYDIDDNGVLTEIAQSVGWGPDSYWKGLAVGDLDGDGFAEIVAHRNFDGDYKVFKLNGGSLSNPPLIEKFPIPQTQDNVMCFGNFDPSSKNEELVTLRKDGGIVMFSSTKVVNSPANNSNNRSADPCQEELPAVLFSFMKSVPFHNSELKEEVLVKGVK